MKTILKLFLFIMAVVASGLAISNELEKADTLYNQKNYKEALAIYLKPQYRNIPLTQVYIGYIYLQPGFKDEKKSTEWFQKAADQGNAKGMHNLAMAYQSGVGVQKDYTKAFNLFKQASDKGLASSMNAIGIMYKNGWGVKTDEKAAANWYMKAAAAGSADGVCNVAGIMMYSKIVETDYKQAHELLDACLKSSPNNDCCLDRMAELYGGGYGVPTDYKKAHQLREKSAANGSVMAMYNLGRDFDYGIGADKDPKAAMSWYQKAAAKGNAKAMYRLYEVFEHGKLGQAVDKTKAAEWKARAERAMKEQGLSRNEWVDDFRLKMEEADKD